MGHRLFTDLMRCYDCCRSTHELIEGEIISGALSLTNSLTLTVSAPLQVVVHYVGYGETEYRYKGRYDVGRYSETKGTSVEFVRDLIKPRSG